MVTGIDGPSYDSALQDRIRISPYLVNKKHPERAVLGVYTYEVSMRAASVGTAKGTSSISS